MLSRRPKVSSLILLALIVDLAPIERLDIGPRLILASPEKLLAPSAFDMSPT